MNYRVIFLLLSAFVASRAFTVPESNIHASISVGARQKARVLRTTSVKIASTIVDNDIGSVGIRSEQPQEQRRDEDTFDWFKAWYPLVPVEILDPEIPHHFTLLGMDLVVWNDGKIPGVAFQSKKDRPKNAKREMGEWRVFEDECPHRKVPLSEGRVEDDGSLLCSYHGWQFEGTQGKLVDVPQLEQDSAQLQAVQMNPKSQCSSFPVQIVDGVLWIWPSTGDDARLESALTPVNSYQGHKEIEATSPDRVWYGPWNYRQLPYGADFFIENVVDPAHVSISHHNVVGSRYSDQRMSMKHITKLTKDGFAVEVNVQGNNSTTTFSAPSHVAIEAPFGDKGAFQCLELYASPSLPGFSNHVGRIIVVKDEAGATPKLLRTFTAPIPKWLNHVLAAAFLNQDAVFLHQQERLMAKKGQYTTLNNSNKDHHSGDEYSQAVLPIEADKGVLFFRQWMSKFAGKRIPYKNNPTMPPVDSSVCFDQYNSHMATCQICQTALRRLKKIRFVSFFLATCLAVVRPLQRRPLWNFASVLVSAGLGLGLNKLIGMFYKYEFSHSHND